MKNNQKKKGMVVSLPELCQILGISRPTARGWIGKGMPVVRKPDKNGRGEYRIDTLHAIIWRYVPEAMDEKGILSVQELKRKLLELDLEKAKLELLKLKNEVIYRQDALYLINNMIVSTRQMMRTVPAKVAALLAIEDQATECKRLVLDEIDHALVSLANMVIDENGDVRLGEDEHGK